MTVAEQVAMLLADLLRCPLGRVVSNASLADDLGADSMERIEIVWVLEAHFHVAIPDEEIPKLKRVGDIIALLDRLGAR